jgi:hypothetical protein
MANSSNSGVVWGFVGFLTGAASLVVSIGLLFDQSSHNEATRKESLAVNLEAIIPECTSFFNGLPADGPVCLDCALSQSNVASQVNCPECRSPIEVPLLVYRYEECKRIAKSIPNQMTSYDYLLMAVAADRLGFSGEAISCFSDALVKAKYDGDSKVDDLVVLVNYAHFLYLRPEITSITKPVLSEGYISHYHSFRDVDGNFQVLSFRDSLGSFGEGSIGIIADITSQWALDQFAYDSYGNLSGSSKKNNFDSAAKNALYANSLYSRIPNGRHRRDLFYQRLGSLANRNPDILDWIVRMNLPIRFESAVKLVPIASPELSEDAPAPPNSNTESVVVPAKPDEFIYRSNPSQPLFIELSPAEYRRFQRRQR